MGGQVSTFFSFIRTNDEALTNQTTYGVSLSAQAERSLGEYVEIGANIGVSQLGAILIAPEEYYSYEGIFVDIPFYLKLRTKEINYSRYFIKAGASFHLLTTDRSLIQTDNTDKATGENLLGGAHTGLLVGLGIEYNFVNGIEAQIGADFYFRGASPLSIIPDIGFTNTIYTPGIYASILYELNRNQHGY